MIVAQCQSTLAKPAASVNHCLTRPPRLILIDAPLSSCLSPHTYRKIRNTLPQVHEMLRRMKQHHGGELTLTEIIREENEDYYGPAGFKGRGKDGVETRDVTFGTFTGHIAVHKDYNPPKELETIHRKLMSVAANAYDQDALDFICGMTEAQRNAAVVILRDVEDGIGKFKARLLDLSYFYTRQNADRFGQFFGHELNNIYCKVEYTTVRGQPTLRFKKGASHYDLIRGSWAEKLEFDWPSS
ncbi:hypothetical protein ACVWYH_009038 [Bradyrhizobium sp. GM24.11]